MPIGYQDHCDADNESAFWLPAASLGMNISILEKHITHDRSKKGIDYELPRNKENYPKYVFYGGSTLIGQNLSLNFIWPFDDPMLFFIPGLIYYLKNEDSFTNHRELINELKNKVSSFSHEIKLQHEAYTFNFM